MIPKTVRDDPGEVRSPAVMVAGMTTFVVVGGSVSPERASDYVRSAAVSLNRISSASIADTSAALTVATSNPSTLTTTSGDTNNGAIRTTTTTPTTTTTNTPTGNVLTEITVENGVNEGNAQNQNNNVDEGQCGQNDDKDGPRGRGPVAEQRDAVRPVVLRHAGS